MLDQGNGSWPTNGKVTKRPPFRCHQYRILLTQGVVEHAPHRPQNFCSQNIRSSKTYPKPSGDYFPNCPYVRIMNFCISTWEGRGDPILGLK